VKEAADRDRETQTLNLARRLSDDKKDRVLHVVSLLKAKFHYASWFEAGLELVRSWFEAGSNQMA